MWVIGGLLAGWSISLPARHRALSDCPGLGTGPAAARSARQLPRHKQHPQRLWCSRALDLTPIQAAPLPPQVIRAGRPHPQPLIVLHIITL